MSEPNTVLIVDDGEINRTLLKKILSSDYTLLEAEDGKKAMDIINKNYESIACVVLDLVMPVMNGFEVLAQMSSSSKLKNILVVVTTGDDSDSNEIQALSAGAWDFVKKPFVASVLKFRIRNAIERSQYSAFAQLKYMAEFDTLTGIYNKDMFYQQAKRMMSSGISEKYAVIRLDINHFSLINSFFGIDEGNALLKYIAKCLRTITADYEDSEFGRMEADIFGICIPYKDEENIKEFVSLTISALKGFNATYYIVPCFGIYIAEGTDIPVNIMFDRAALASKKCKGNYVNVYEFYNDDMRKKLEKEQEIVNEMNYALAQNQFVLYVQPKYNVMKNTPAGGEVLVRWLHPEKGMISPGLFIPVFEKNGFITRLDNYVWEKACQLLKGWIDMGKKPNPISVNISRVNLYNPNFVENIIELVDKYNVPHELYNLELTESAYTDNPDIMKTAIKKLQKNGFTVLMDDFGSGYSSLNMLKDIPVDILKIDMNFFTDSEINGRCESIIASVVRMSKWLNIPVIAEGVEKPEQIRFLREVGCEYVQGYYYAKPMPAKDYEKYAFEGENVENQQKTDEENKSGLMSDIDKMLVFSDMPQAVAILECTEDSIEVIRVNDAFFDLYHFDSSSLAQAGPLEKVLEADRALLRDTINRVIATRQTQSCEYRRILDDQTDYKWICGKFKYIEQVGNNHIIMANPEDITAEKEMDSELDRYRRMMGSDMSITNRMLIVDDQIVNRELLKTFFADQFTMYEAANGVQALNVLKDNSIDIILLDLGMPVMSGEEFLKVKNADKKLAGIPVIIISADESPQQQSTLLSIGANDYIVKPFSREIALRRVNNVLEADRHFKEILHRYNADYSVQNDFMTGVYNRNTAENVVNSMNITDDNINAFIVIDVDNFTAINRRCGTKSGDKVLIDITYLLKNLFRSNDIVARIGNDEICVFMNSMSSKLTLSQNAEY